MKMVQDQPRQESEQHLLYTYVADLELEVDRLRKLTQFMQHESRQAVAQIRQACDEATDQNDAASTLVKISDVTRDFADVLRDAYEPTGYHPAHDQVVAIALRPLIEQVFRWQQRFLNAPEATLHLELATEHVDWFPARLRHIIDNLISNALRYRDPDKGEARVSLSLSRSSAGYNLRVSDNGLGMPWKKRAAALELYHRSGPARSAVVGVGVAVVKFLLEESGGSLTVESSEGQGTSFMAVLPYYSHSDYLR